ncbi:hypothetical protein E4T80_00085 [Muribacter muris]|uniref:Uncharacterized protein n=1 Tax=Muribacter muris TaxID=67855 RepID=A0A4Y9K7Y8_9PAST|nr:hypothetical protein [Muribacter muris]MBF0783878.1 hypothetical protein [Muribacter muris]MBF0826376.1 hypothetical protein [Muribacter muris]TFV13279.1 hypothetical protein E4T80_00085 [Muribacter muris]
MLITYAKPILVVNKPLVLMNNARVIEKPLRKVPKLSNEEIAVFSQIERKAGAMTIDDLMKAMGIK